MQQVRDFVMLDGADLAADRELATEILAAYVEHDRRRHLRIRLVHAVAVASAPIQIEIAFPGLFSPATVRTLFAAWLGLAIWAFAIAVSEWRTRAAQTRRLRALRRRSGR